MPLYATDVEWPTNGLRLGNLPSWSSVASGNVGQRQTSLLLNVHAKLIIRVQMVR